MNNESVSSYGFCKVVYSVTHASCTKDGSLNHDMLLTTVRVEGTRIHYAKAASKQCMQKSNCQTNMEFIFHRIQLATTV